LELELVGVKRYSPNLILIYTKEEMKEKRKIERKGLFSLLKTEA